MIDANQAMERIRRNQGVSGLLIENGVYVAREFRLRRKTKRNDK